MAKKASSKKRRGEIVEWHVDEGFRVPSFVIEMTGLDTKKKILKCYGAHTVFRKHGDVPVFNERDPTVQYDPQRGRLDRLTGATKKPGKR